MNKSIGIDLGTSTSEIAVLIDGKPFVIPNDKGEKITPSVVYFNGDEVKVGSDARSYAVLEPENTVIEVKRLMGSGQVIRAGGRRLSPQEVSSYILRYLKKCAEDYLGEKVGEAVITVPAYFTNEQRVATREAGELAGLKVERIINEPTSAALAYGIDHMQDQKHVLVYDLGGGTLDVTVLEIFMGVVDVKASSGNNSLGGKDFDEAVINHIAKEFFKEHDIDLRYDRKAMSRLKEAVEAAKIRLSDEEDAELDIPFIAARDGKPLGISKKLTRRKFESLIEDMVCSTLQPIDRVLDDAGLKVEDIDTILLVGGSTRIPLVQRMIRDKFGKEPHFEVDPEEAVAMGAAVQAGIKQGELSGENDIIVTDVCPYTLGTEVLKEFGGIRLPGFFDPLIKRNATIPVTVKKFYSTASDDQERAEIRIYQGDDSIAEKNNFIGSFMLENIPKAGAGEEKLEVRFSYDINGILDVSAVVVSTGNEKGITVDTRQIKPKAEIDVEKEWKNSKFARKVKSLIKNAEKKLSDANTDEDVKEEISLVLYDLKYSLARNDEISIKRYEDELTELLYGLESED